MYTKEEIVTVFTKPEIEVGLKKYLEIMDLLYKTDVSENENFKKLYNHFYRMRQRKAEFYEVYYDYMERMKTNQESLTFEEVFLFVKQETGRCESSFSSKLLATLNPNKPVWDKFVLENLGIKKIYSGDSNREQKTIEAYNQICQWYENFMESDNAKLIIGIFDELYPNTMITDTKKVDLFLWQHREK